MSSSADRDEGPRVPGYCCRMMARFVIGIVAENLKAPEPVDVIDFLDLDHKTPSGKPILVIKFCPFCGKPPTGPRRVVG